MNELQFFIQPSFTNSGVAIWCQSYDPHTLKCFNHTVENGEVIVAEFDDKKINKDMQPFIHLPRRIADDFFRAVAEYMAKVNIKTRDQSLIEGKLQATEEHLKDMQKIAFKMLKI